MSGERERKARPVETPAGLYFVAKPGARSAEKEASFLLAQICQRLLDHLAYLAVAAGHDVVFEFLTICIIGAIVNAWAGTG